MEENQLAIQNELTNEDIKSLIYTIRGKQVMLDCDVARLYNYQTNFEKEIHSFIDPVKQLKFVMILFLILHLLM